MFLVADRSVGLMCFFDWLTYVSKWFQLAKWAIIPLKKMSGEFWCSWTTNFKTFSWETYIFTFLQLKNLKYSIYVAAKLEHLTVLVSSIPSGKVYFYIVLNCSLKTNTYPWQEKIQFSRMLSCSFKTKKSIMNISTSISKKNTFI